MTGRRDLTLLRALSEEGYEMDWFCFVSLDDCGRGAASFDPVALRRLAALPIHHELDIYGAHLTVSPGIMRATLSDAQLASAVTSPATSLAARGGHGSSFCVAVGGPYCRRG